MADVGGFLLGAELDAAEIGNADDAVGVLAHDQALELVDAFQVRVGQKVDLNLAAFGAADGGEEVVAQERGLDVARAETEGGEAVGVEPDAHGLRTRALEADALNVRNGRET